MVNVIDNPNLSTKNYIVKYGAVGYIQRIFVYFALWWVLPIVLIIFTLTYVKKHDIAMSYYLASLSLLSIFFVIGFWSKYEKIPFLRFLSELNYRMLLTSLLLAFEIFFMVFVIPWSMQGDKYDFLRPWLCVDLSYQVLINKPGTDYKGIYWADLRGIHLEGANLESTVLKRADLRYSHLYRANLSVANLQEARLDSANLQGANLQRADLQRVRSWGANLQGADLWGANVQGAYLWVADFQGAYLTRANFQGAYLMRADLQEGVLSEANLQGADLRWSKNLTIDQLKKVKTLYEAQLDSALLDSIEAEYPLLREPPEEEEEKPSP